MIFERDLFWGYLIPLFVISLQQDESSAESYATDTSSGWTSEEELDLDKQSRKAKKKISAAENFTAIRSKNEVAPEVIL